MPILEAIEWFPGSLQNLKVSELLGFQTVLIPGFLHSPESYQ